MFEDIDSLPGSQREIAIVNWNGQADICQHGADVRGGIVGTFKIMGVPTVPFGDEAFHERLQIRAGGGVPVLADNQRSAGMLKE